MKMLKRILILCLVCCLFSGCDLIDNMMPELSAEKQEFCFTAVEYFAENAKNLNGENLKIFLSPNNINHLELVTTHEAALEEYGESMTETEKNAYWTVVIVDYLFPKECEFTDYQISKMNIEIDRERVLRGLMDTGVPVRGTLSFEDNSMQSRDIEIGIRAERPITGGSQYVPIITYIKFID